MKRFVLPAILLFPVVSLVLWVWLGVGQRKHLPLANPGDTNAPALNTNASPAK